ncbi:MAG: phosphoribosyltransferase family protein [Pseudomonadota bacterium]
MQTIYAKDKNIEYIDTQAKVYTGDTQIVLPVVPLAGTPINIILFDSFGQMKLIQDTAKEAVKHFTKPDYIVCPEAKSIPVAQEMARLWDIDYFVLRKSKKLYMQDPKSIDTKSITTLATQQLWYDASTIHVLQNKNIMIFDDVISSGGTIASVLAFAKDCSLCISSIASIFLEGHSPYVADLKASYTLEHLGFLPIIE